MRRHRIKAHWPLPLGLRATVALPFVLLAVGCAGTPGAQSKRGSSRVDYLASARTVGRAPRFRPSPSGALVSQAARVDGMSCNPVFPATSVAHIELFAANRVVVIPAGIGFAPPLARRGAYVQTGRCVYPLRTVEPTGLVLSEAGRTRHLGQLFDLWGQPLNRREVAGFHASHGQHVSVFFDGTLWPGSPISAPISPHAQITIEVGPYVRPHASYSFPPLRSIGRESHPAGPQSLPHP